MASNLKINLPTTTSNPPLCASLRKAIFLFAAVPLTLFSLSVSGREQYDRMGCVPSPGSVVIDGDLDDWDLTGSIETHYEEALIPAFQMTFATMHGEEGLYLSANFVDVTPMLNAHDPAVEATRGWAGDSLQVRMYSKPGVKLPFTAESRSEDDRICHLTMWYHTATQTPVLQIQYGMDYHGTKVWTGVEAGVAFRRHDDGAGYTLEALISWARLNASDVRPREGDALAFTFQPLWGNTEGTKQKVSYFESVTKSSFAFQGTGAWGTLNLLAEGQLEYSQRPATSAVGSLLKWEIDLPDPEARTLSAALLDTGGKIIRNLPVVQQDTALGDHVELEPDRKGVQGLKILSRKSS